MDLWEFAALDGIHEQEIAAGRYKAPVEEKAAQVSSTKTQIASLSAELKITEDFLNWYAPRGNYEDRIAIAKTLTTALTGHVDAEVPTWNQSQRSQAVFQFAGNLHESEIKQRVDTLTAQKEKVKARTCWKLAAEMTCLIGRSRSRSRRPVLFSRRRADAVRIR